MSTAIFDDLQKSLKTKFSESSKNHRRSNQMSEDKPPPAAPPPPSNQQPTGALASLKDVWTRLKLTTYKVRIHREFCSSILVFNKIKTTAARQDDGRGAAGHLRPPQARQLLQAAAAAAQAGTVILRLLSIFWKSKNVKI